MIEMLRRERTDGQIDVKLTQALAKLSNAEWRQVKCDEAQQRIIRDLFKRYRELRDRKIDREPAR